MVTWMTREVHLSLAQRMGLKSGEEQRTELTKVMDSVLDAAQDRFDQSRGKDSRYLTLDEVNQVVALIAHLKEPSDSKLAEELEYFIEGPQVLPAHKRLLNDAWERRIDAVGL